MRLFAIVAIMVCLFRFAPAEAAETGRFSAPVINPAGGAYPTNAAVRVCIRGVPGTETIYTLDGSIPDWNRGTRSSASLVFFDLPPGDVVVKAAAYRPGDGIGTVASARFVRETP